MTKNNAPYMLYADERGKVYDHSYYRMAGFSGNSPARINARDLIRLPRFSKLFYIPDCPPIGIDPATGMPEVVEQIKVGSRIQRCFAVAAFLEPRIKHRVRSGLLTDGRDFC